jgi:hypothetical protein
LFASTWASPTHRLIGAGLDTELVAWFVSWTPHALLHGQNPLLTGDINAPGQVNLMWNNTMPLAGLVLSPVSSLFGPVVASNLLITACPVLSAWTCSAVLHRLTGDRLAAFFGGALYGFSPYMLGHALGQPHVALAFGPPLLLLLLHAIVVGTGSLRRNGLLLGGLALAQLFLSEELLASEALIATLVLCGLALSHRDRVVPAARRLAAALAWAVSIFLPLAAIPLAVQFFGPERPVGTIFTSATYSNDLLNIVVPTQLNALEIPGLSRQFAPNTLEATAYLGVPLLIAMAVSAAVLWRRRPIVRVAALSAIAVAVLSLGPRLLVDGHDVGVPLPWRLLSSVPVVNDILPSRLWLYVDLCAAVLLCEGIAAMRSRSARVRQVGAVAGVVVAASLLPMLPYPTYATSVPPLFASPAAHVLDDRVVLLVPFASCLDARSMLWHATADMRFRMPEGYVITSGKELQCPKPTATWSVLRRVQFAGDDAQPTAAEVTEMFAELRSWHVDLVAVGPMEHEERAIRLFTDVLGDPGEPVGGVRLWRLPA